MKEVKAMAELKGSKTEKNLMAAFAGKSRREISTLIMRLRLKRTVLFR